MKNLLGSFGIFNVMADNFIYTTENSKTNNNTATKNQIVVN